MGMLTASRPLYAPRAASGLPGAATTGGPGWPYRMPSSEMPRAACTSSWIRS